MTAFMVGFVAGLFCFPLAVMLICFRDALRLDEDDESIRGPPH